MNSMPLLLVMYVLLAELSRMKDCNGRAFLDIVIGVLSIVFVFVGLRYGQMWVSQICEIGMSAICLHLAIKVRFPIGSFMRTKFVSCILLIIAILMMGVCAVEHKGWSFNGRKISFCLPYDKSNKTVNVGLASRVSMDNDVKRECDLLYGTGVYESATITKTELKDWVRYDLLMPGGTNFTMKVAKGARYED